MKTVHVDTGRPYDIYIERGVIDSAGEYAKKLSNAQKVTIITDSNVAPLYQWRVINSLSAAGFTPSTGPVPIMKGRMYSVAPEP